jgi:hypothetical protein
MGGYNSGRTAKVNCTEDYLSIDARQWQRDGVLVAGTNYISTWSRAGQELGNIGVKAEQGQVTLSYSWQQNDSEAQRLDYPVGLETTSCHYGGVRYWFTCPTENCGKRVAKLYLSDKYFSCRQCCRLAYYSQREAQDDRARRRAEKIRAKLSWQPGLMNLPGAKPKGMHWKTYVRLMTEYRDDANQTMLGMNAKMELMSKRLEALCDRL